jgi:hypothetical protein
MGGIDVLFKKCSRYAGSGPVLEISVAGDNLFLEKCLSCTFLSKKSWQLH